MNSPWELDKMARTVRWHLAERGLPVDLAHVAVCLAMRGVTHKGTQQAIYRRANAFHQYGFGTVMTTLPA